MTLFSFAENTMAEITPKMATSSQKMILINISSEHSKHRERRGLGMYEIKFFVRMRGALTPPPKIDVPVMKIPLCTTLEIRGDGIPCCTYYG